MMHQRASRPDLYGEFRFRIPLPLAVPMLALALIGFVTFGFSRILLNVTKDIAVAIALMTAINILAACAFIALRRNLSPSTIAELFVVALYPLFIGVVISYVGIGAATNAEATPHGAGAPPGATSQVVARGVEFQQDEITIPAEETAQIDFVNEDSVQHNIAIYETEQDADAQENALFDGGIIDGGDDILYEFEPPPPGEYIFQCDVHPSMRGTAIVE